MRLRFDHAIIAVHDLDEATENYKALGFNPLFGGVHAGGGTHNALIYFADGSYLELLAPTGKTPEAGKPDFTTLLQRGEGLIGYALGSDDLSTTVQYLRDNGLTVADVQEGGRKRQDGIELRWKSAMIVGSMSPFFIEDVTPRNQRVLDDSESTQQPNGITGISAVHIIINHDLSRRYEQILGEEQSMYTLSDGVSIHLIPPENDDLKGYMDVRGDAPFALYLKGEAGLMFHLEQSHHARLIVG